MLVVFALCLFDQKGDVTLKVIFLTDEDSDDETNSVHELNYPFIEPSEDNGEEHDGGDASSDKHPKHKGSTPAEKSNESDTCLLVPKQ